MDHPPKRLLSGWKQLSHAGDDTPVLLRYSTAFVIVVIAAVFRVVLDPLLAGRAVYIAFLLAILATARNGGVGPGLTATFLATLTCDYFFLEPRFNLAMRDRDDIDGLIFFAIAGIGASVFAGRLRSALARSRHEEQRLRIVSNTIPQILWTARPDGLRDYVNERFYEFTGANPGEGLEDRWMAFVHPDDRLRIFGHCARVMEAGTDCTCEFRMRRRDGAYRWSECRMVPSRDASGQVTKWFGASTDIQESRELREAARAEAERFRLLVATAPGAIFQWQLRSDGSLAMPFASPAVREICGLNPADLTEDAAPFLDLIQPDDRAATLEKIAESARANSNWRGEFRVLHPVHGELWIAGHAAPLREPDGAVNWFGYLSDVTETKRAELALRDSEHTIRTLLNSASQAILAVNRESKIVLLNPMAGAMFGYETDALKGQSVSLLIPPEIVESHPQFYADYFADPHTRPMGIGTNLEAVRRDGGRFPIEVSLSSIDTAAGPLAVAFVTDITVRRQMEETAKSRAAEINALARRLLTAQEDERRRVSRELHDGTCQQLAHLSIEIGKLAAVAPEGTRSQLRALQVRATQAAEDARHIAHELHPAILDDLGVVASLRSLCNEVSHAHAIAVRFRHGNLPPSISREVGSSLYRIAQQSLQNVAEHSGATWVMVGLVWQQGNLILTVRDDGIGFEPEKIRGSGSLGLIGMEERAQLVKGRLIVSTRRGRGTRIALRIPYQADAT